MEERKDTTISLLQETKSRLQRIRSLFSLNLGKDLSYDETLNELIDFYEAI